MSYHRSLPRAPRMRSRIPLGSIQSNPILHRRVPRYLQVTRPPLGSLGDDTLAATTVAPSASDGMTQDQFNTQMLATMQSVRDWQQRWVQKDELQRWLQLAATVSIPVMAGIWRAIGFKRAETP